MDWRSFLGELRRRRVLRAATLYAIGAWGVLQFADLAMPAWGIPDGALRSVFAALLLGFPVALVFGWHFDVRADGVTRTPPALRSGDRPVDLSLTTGDYVVLGLLAAVVLTITFGTGLKLVGTSRSEMRITAAAVPPGSIAVLPFLNVGEDPNNEYFSEGISGELLNLLARVPGLQVAARTSSFSFRESDADVATIAGRLGVRHVLEGSVRRDGARVRIAAQLINAETGFQLWSDSFDRELDDVFVVQDEIAGAIVEALREHLRPEDMEAVRRSQAPTRDLMAYELYLQGIYLWQQRGEENLRRSVALFEEAIARDPSFASAYAGLAAAYAVLVFWASDVEEEFGRLAEEAALETLALDPGIGTAHAVLAGRRLARGQWAMADASYRNAIALEPSNASAPHWFADFLQQVGRASESARMAERALRIDPVSPVRNVVAAVSYLFAGEAERARHHRDTAYRLGLAQDEFLPLLFALHEGRQADVAAFLGERFRAAGADGAWLAAVVDAFHEPAGMEPGRTALREAFAAGLLPQQQAFLLAIYLGDTDFAMERGAALARRASWYMVGFWLEEAEHLRRDPRFTSLMTEIGLVDYWRTHGWPDACEPGPGGGLSCA